jgi:hypothetical protein
MRSARSRARWGRWPGILLEQLQDDALDLFRQARHQGPGRHRAALDVHPGELVGGLGLKHPLARAQPVKERAEGVEVRARVDDAPGDLLRRGVSEGADKLPGPGDRLVRQEPGGAEVEELRRAVA